MVVTHNVLCAVHTVFRHNVYAFLFFLPMFILLRGPDALGQLPSGSGSLRAVAITPRLSPLSVHTYDASSRLRHHVPFRYAEELRTMWILSQSLHQFTSFTSHGLVGVQ
ncbi:hypothetical protein BJV77DRAFT_142791 [Russula vinacea]|nr:hypothetical protein BJV77DRAFT_142791 [Russula vinacea]